MCVCSCVVVRAFVNPIIARLDQVFDKANDSRVQLFVEIVQVTHTRARARTCLFTLFFWQMIMYWGQSHSLQRTIQWVNALTNSLTHPLTSPMHLHTTAQYPGRTSPSNSSWCARPDRVESSWSDVRQWAMSMPHGVRSGTRIGLQSSRESKGWRSSGITDGMEFRLRRIFYYNFVTCGLVCIRWIVMFVAVFGSTWEMDIPGLLV